MKYIIYFGLIFVIFISTVACNTFDLSSIGVQNKYKDNSFKGVDLVHVDRIPDGYVLLSDINEQYRDLMQIVFFESQISFLDLDGNNIQQVSISDKNFLVQYKDNIYLNTKKLQVILNLAEGAAEKGRRTYKIGEPFETYDIFSEPISVTVDTVTYVDNYQSLSINNNEWFCVVMMSMIDNTDKSLKDYIGNDNSIWQYFDYAESFDGQKYTKVFQSDSNKMIFSLPYKQKAKYLFIKSPSSSSCIRKIDISGIE